MPAIPTSRRTPPLLLVVAFALLAWSWWLQPERAIAWVTTVLLLAGMAIALGLATRRSRKGPAERLAADAIARGVVFGASIMVVSLGMKLGVALGALESGERPVRVTMAVMGLFFVAAGNVMPKMLTPLAALQCDVAHVQAFQRFTGWTWVLMGLALAAVWIGLPIGSARPVSALLILSSALIVLAHCIRLRRLSQKGLPA